MSWDCSLIMRTSIDQQPVSIGAGRFVHHKSNIKTTTTGERPNQNNHKQSLKLKRQQADKSKEIHKKKSLKSKNTSKNKNTQLQRNQGGSSIVQQEFSRVMPSPTYSQIYKRNIRMQTQPCQNQFVRPVSSAFQIIKTHKQNQTHESFVISKKKQIINTPNSPNFIITNHSPVYISPPITYQARKISAFCPTQRLHIQNLKYKNAQNRKQFEKVKPNINQNKSKQVQQTYNLKILPATISFKSIIEDRNEKKHQKIDKQNIKNFENETKQISKNLNFQQKSKNNISNKKRKIQDFLNQRSQIKSVQDESQLSEQQCSQIILSYGQLLRQRGKFELNSNYILI